MDASQPIVVQDNLNRALASIILDAAKGVKQGITFLSQQIPDVIHQLIVYKTVLYSAFVIIGVILGLIAIKAVKLAYSNKWEKYDERPIMLGLFVVAPCTVLSFVLLARYGVSLLEITLAPKVWLIEYAAQLVGK